jgi:hypothetical protein
MNQHITTIVVYIICYHKTSCQQKEFGTPEERFENESLFPETFWDTTSARCKIKIYF